MDDFPEKYRYDIAIIRETTEQILRDINIEGFKINLTGEPRLAFEELKSQLIPLVSRLFNNDKILLQSLLYRIDINEKDYKKALAIGTTNDIEEALTELIIRREFQKVLTRRYFKIG